LLLLPVAVHFTFVVVAIVAILVVGVAAVAVAIIANIVAHHCHAFCPPWHQSKELNQSKPKWLLDLRK
jgi:hypothetical protein